MKVWQFGSKDGGLGEMCSLSSLVFTFEAMPLKWYKKNALRVLWKNAR
jgi:hypothetical protein